MSTIQGWQNQAFIPEVVLVLTIMLKQKTFITLGATLNFQVGKQYDYFEPRTEGRFFIYENRLNSNIWFSSNYNKKFAFDTSIGGATFFEKNRNTNEFWFGLSPRIRFNDKLLITFSFEYSKDFNDRGYTATT